MQYNGSGMVLTNDMFRDVTHQPFAEAWTVALSSRSPGLAVLEAALQCLMLVSVAHSWTANACPWQINGTSEAGWLHAEFT
jgi:hypothetical protein